MRSRRPVLDGQARDHRQVRVAADDGAITQRQGHGGDLHVDLLNDPAAALEFGKEASVLIRGALVVRPADELGQTRPGGDPGRVWPSSSAGLTTRAPRMSTDASLPNSRAAAGSFSKSTCKSPPWP